MMRVLVTWASPHGGTEGIGRLISGELEAVGFDVVAQSAKHVTDASGFDAAIVGGALYANRWPSDARRFVARHVHALRKMPVWFFSSGPLDDSADQGDLPVPSQVEALATRVGAREHKTFGGRLEPDAKGFPAAAMAKKMSGDWRNEQQIQTWAAGVARQIPDAKPGHWSEPSGRSLGRWVAFPLVGWILLAAVLLLVTAVWSATAGIVVHAILAPLVFASLAWAYTNAMGFREALPTAVLWVGVVLALYLFAARLGPPVFDDLVGRALGFSIPLLLIFGATWATTFMRSTLPWPD